MRISDWSSDVCSSDLAEEVGDGRMEVDAAVRLAAVQVERDREDGQLGGDEQVQQHFAPAELEQATGEEIPGRSKHRKTDSRDRKSVVEGKSVSVRVGLGVRGTIKKKKNQTNKV